MMNIALIGYGKMGKAIEQIAIARGHKIGLKICSSNISDLNSESLKDIDIAIDFSIPTSAKNNILTILNEKTPIISGTTGWTESLSEVETVCKKMDTAFLYASNFSLGVNLFFELNKRLAKLMANYTDYEVSMTEIHHTQKLDAPSGTAISLAEQIIDQRKAQHSWSINNNNSKEELYINAIRQADVPGTHTVKYRSDIDTISISHEAHNRKGFALGAVLAAEWIKDKKGVYTMQDMLFS